MSNPLVAGAAAVVRDFYQKAYGHTASAALVKAALINSAVDLLDENNDGINDNAFPIPNIHEGWGRVDLAGATSGRHRFVDDTAGVTTGQPTLSQFSVDTGADSFRVTLVWSDYPSAEYVALNLVNDLDLIVTSPSGVTYLGNVFDGGWSQPNGNADRVNNVENVYVKAAEAGTWTVEVRAYNLPFGPQPFALVVDYADRCYDFQLPKGVGAEDLQIIAAAWHRATGLFYDLDNDAKVTVVDIMRAGLHWNVSCLTHLSMQLTPKPDSIIRAGTVNSLTITFRDAIDPATITGPAIRLSNIGLDEVSETPDDFGVTGGAFLYDSQAHAASLSFATPLPAGRYRATLGPPLAGLSGVFEITWSFEIAPLLEFGAVLTSSIVTPEDTDPYLFSGVTDDQILIRMLTTSDGLDSEIEVYDPDGIHSYYCSGTGDGKRLTETECKLEASGTYTIFARDEDSNSTGGYTLQLQRLNQPPTASFVEWGQILTGSITSPVATSAYSFDASSGDQVRIGVAAITSTFDPAVRVYQPDGSEIYCDRKGGYGAKQIVLKCDLEASGLHTFLINDFEDNNTGSYNIQLQRLNQPPGATSVVWGQTLTGQISSPVAINAYTFTGAAGDQVLVRAIATAGKLKLELQAYDPNGIDSCGDYDWSGSKSLIEIVCTPEVDGIQSLFIGDYDGELIGSYAVQSHRLNQAPAATPIQPGTTLIGSISTLVEADIFTFAGVVGEIPVLTATKTSGTFTPEVRLYDPNGETVSCQLDGGYGDDQAQITCELSLTGMHTVLISDYGNDGTGNYMLERK